MKQIIIGDVLNQAWELTKKHWATILVCLIGMYIIQYILTTLTYTGGMNMSEYQALNKRLQDAVAQNPNDLPYVISQVGDFYSHMLPHYNAFAYLVQIITLVLAVGFSQTCLNCARGNGDFSINAWKQPIGLYIKIIVTEIIVDIIVGIGYLCCILPGIYLSARLKYYTYYLLDHKEAGIDKAIAASWNMTQENAMNLSLLQVIYFFMYIAGLICCCIGFILPAILVPLASVVCYLTLAPEQPKAEVEVAE